MDQNQSSTLGDIAGQTVGGLFSIPFQMYGASQARKFLNRASGDINTGYDAAGNLATAGQSRMENEYNPYSAGAQRTYQATGDYLGNMSQPTQANLFKMDANSANPYMNRMSMYQADQANKALNNSALSRGGVGGGLAQALANNTMKYATQNYTDANTMASNANNQNWQQANQNYLNNANWNQGMFNNLISYGNQGIGQQNIGNQIWNQYQGNQAQNEIGRGQDLASINASKAGVSGNLFNSIGNTMGQIGAATGPLFTYGMGGAGSNINNNAK